MDLEFDLDREVVALIRAQVIELPTFPAVALQLQRTISAGDFGLEALAKLVVADQALASNVIRAANSAFYVGSTPVTTVPQAVSRIGAKELTNIAIAGTLGLRATAPGPLEGLRRESWRRSLVAGLLAQELAKARHQNPGEAFLAGLLHDFGETIAFACFETILELHPGSRPQHAASWEWEAQKYHLELGQVLASQWKLPGFVTEAVMRHHEATFETCEFPELVGLIALCDAVSTRVFDAPSVEAVTLDGLGATDGEVAALRRVLPKVSSYVESLENLNVAPVPRVVKSAVEQPKTELTGVVNEALDLEVIITKKSQTETYRARAISTGAIRLEGLMPQPERHLVNLEVKGPQPIKLCATVLRCTSSDAGSVVELKPFAMNGETERVWLGWVHAKASAAA